MGRLNFVDLEEDETEIAAVSPAEAAENTQYEILPASGKSRGAEAMASAINPYAGIVSIINSSLDLVSDISKCLTLISIEKQKTERVRIKAYAEIEEARQKTKRVKIQEKEATNRIIIQCEANVAAQKLELEKLREENRFREVELQKNHELYLQQLSKVDKCVESVIEQKNILLQSLQDRIYDEPYFQGILSSLDKANKNLVEFSGQIMALQKR